MKTKYYSYFCIAAGFLILLLLPWACIREFEPRPEPNRPEGLDVTLAQELFEKLAQELIVAGTSHSGTEIAITPLWKYSRSFSLVTTQTVEAPLNIVPSYSYRAGDPDSVMHRIIANTVRYLVAQKEEGREEVAWRVVFFIADDDYLMDDPLKLGRLSLSSLPGFSGKILNYDIHGELLGGEVYDGGEMAGVIRPLDAYPAPVVRGDDPGGRYHERFWVVPTGVTERGDNIILDDLIVTGNPFYPEECDYSGGAGGSGGDGGGSGGGGSGGGWGGGGGSGTNPPPSPVSLNSNLKTLFKGTCSLSDEDKKKLNAAFEQMLAECFYEFINSNMHANNVQLRDILMAEPGWLGQAGITNLGDLKFASSGEITAENLKHEWIHLFQRQHQDIFGNNRGMAEFEVALVQDILFFIEIKGDWENTPRSWACATTQKGAYQIEYMQWLSDLTSNGSGFPTMIYISDFQKFSKIFGEVSISYNTSRGYTYGNVNYTPTLVLQFNQAKIFCNK